MFYVIPFVFFHWVILFMQPRVCERCMYYSLQLNRKTLCTRVLRSELSDFVRSFEGICLLKLLLFARQVQKRNIICAILRFTSKDSNARCFFHTLFPHKSPVLTYIDMIGSANELPHTIWGKGLSFFMRLFPNSKENFIVHFWDLLPKFNESFIYKITKKEHWSIRFPQWNSTPKLGSELYLINN